MATVSYFPAVFTSLRALAAAAVRIGRRAEFIAAVREMEERLRTDPEAWGNPLKDYRGLRLTVYRRYGQVLIVTYAVHIDGSPVFVMNVEPTPGTPLDFAAR
ncbi:MAG TPA: hypothetical protein VKE74_12480 [Gemmataceae bacterium]|nr:hypothetical protein [Gemmataceae bacterium]